MGIEIREGTEREVRLGSLTVDEAVNDSIRWEQVGYHEGDDPYYELHNPEDKDEFGELALDDLVTIADYTIDEGIPSAHIDLTDLIADYLKDNGDFLVFVGLLQQVFDDMKSVADVFDHLADVDSVVEMFLPKLGYLLNYRYNYNVPDSVNRDIIKRLLWLYEQKATDKDVLESADYGANDKWVGSTLFMPEAEPEDRTAEIYYPVHSLFTHDVSAHSRTDRYPDSERYRGGVIVIKVKKLNDRIREAVRRVLPAGLKCYYDFDGSFGGDGTLGSVDFGSWCVVYEDTLIDYAMIQKDRIESQWFDGSYTDKHYLSGRQILFCDHLIDYIMGVSWFTPLPEGDPEGNVLHDPDDFHYEIPAPKKIWKGYATYSERGTLSGKLRLEGDSNTMWAQTPIEPISPKDTYYPVSVIEDLVYNPWLNDSRYHQMYVGDGRYAMNSFWDDPEHFRADDYVEVEDRHVKKFSEVDVNTYAVNGLLPRTYSNNFYLENYCEPFEIHLDRLKRLELDRADFSIPEELPIDVVMTDDMRIVRDVTSDVFDGVRYFGHRFSGNDIDYVELQLDLIRDPVLRIEMVLDQENVNSTTLSGEDTFYGDIRSGLPYFYTDPFEFGKDNIIEMVLENEDVLSDKLSDGDTLYGEVRSGLPEDYQFPFEIKPYEDNNIEMVLGGDEVLSDKLSDGDSMYGDVRSGLSKDYQFPFEVGVETADPDNKA